LLPQLVAVAVVVVVVVVVVEMYWIGPFSLYISGF